MTIELTKNEYANLILTLNQCKEINTMESTLLSDEEKNEMYGINPAKPIGSCWTSYNNFDILYKQLEDRTILVNKNNLLNELHVGYLSENEEKYIEIGSDYFHFVLKKILKRFDLKDDID